MGHPKHKSPTEVETDGISPYYSNSKCREAEGTALASLYIDLLPLSSREYDAVEETLKVLGPFYQATVCLSEEKCMGAPKVIPRHHTVETSNLQTAKLFKLSA